MHETRYLGKLWLVCTSFLTDRDYRAGLGAAVAWNIGDSLVLGGFVLLLGTMDMALGGIAFLAGRLFEELARDLVRMRTAGRRDNRQARRDGPENDNAQEQAFAPQMRRMWWAEVGAGAGCLALGAVVVACGPASLWAVVPILFALKVARYAVQEERAEAYDTYKASIGPMHEFPSHGRFLTAFEMSLARLVANGLTLATCTASFFGLLPLAPWVLALVAIGAGSGVNLAAKARMLCTYGPLLARRQQDVAAAAAARRAAAPRPKAANPLALHLGPRWPGGGPILGAAAGARRKAHLLRVHREDRQL